MSPDDARHISHEPKDAEKKRKLLDFFRPLPEAVTVLDLIKPPPTVLHVATAAIRTPDGIVHSLPRPNRHHNIIWMLANEGYNSRDYHDQGFVLSDGRYVGRREAKKVAVDAGQQLARAMNLEELYSEDVW